MNLVSGSVVAVIEQGLAYYYVIIRLVRGNQAKEIYTPELLL